MAVNVLVVSPYPPIRDGVANYALQEVAALRSEGHAVDVLSPWPSAAHHHLDLRTRRGVAAMARMARRYDRTLVQYHPDVFVEPNTTPVRRVGQNLALARAMRAARGFELQVHEADFGQGRGRSPVALSSRLFWRSVPRAVVHTEAEQHDMTAVFGLKPDRVSLVDHGRHFVRRTSVDRARARRLLGLPADRRILLAIGFIQPHKGFDRAVRAFGRARLGERGCSLYVVGSVRVDDAGNLEYLGELQSLAAQTPGSEVRAGYLGDAEFDRWIVAADAVVLPYRFIWSSSVLERAALYGRPVIATRVRGLAQQKEGVVVVDDEDGLARAMESAAGLDGERQLDPSAGPSKWDLPEGASRDEIQAEVARRAAEARGTPAPAPSARAAPAGNASAPLRRIPPLRLPKPVSGRPGASLLKRMVQRLTSWQLDPIVSQVNAVHRATIEAVDATDTAPRAGRETPDH